MPKGAATTGREPAPIHEPAAAPGTSWILGSKPLFSFRRLGKLMGLGMTSAEPGFLTSGFLPPGNAALVPSIGFHEGSARRVLQARLSRPTCQATQVFYPRSGVQPRRLHGGKEKARHRAPRDVSQSPGRRCREGGRRGLAERRVSMSMCGPRTAACPAELQRASGRCKMSREVPAGSTPRQVCAPAALTAGFAPPPPGWLVAEGAHDAQGLLLLTTGRAPTGSTARTAVNGPASNSG